MKRFLAEVIFWLLATGTLALAAFTILVFQGHFVNDNQEPVVSPPPIAKKAEQPTKAEQPSNAAPREQESTPRRGKRNTDTSAAARMVITATRGDCWLEAREGSAAGKVLSEGILEQGQSVSLKGRLIWLRLGAAANVDVTVNGKPRPLPAGTIESVIPLAGPAAGER
jgi:cytoskeletal protein RodZ